MKGKKIAVVLSIGRSGSSAITRGLTALGINIGSRFLRGSATINPTGLWEDIDIERTNDEILYRLQSRIGGLSVITKEKIEELVPDFLRERAIEVLQTKLSNCDFYGFKDVRIYSLLPFWKPIFKKLSVEATYIVAVRNPVSVAQSIEKLNGSSLFEEKSYFLWLDNIVKSMRETIGEKRVVVDYNNLMKDPILQLNRIAFATGLKPSNINEDELKEYAESFLRQDLNHHDTNFSPEKISFYPKLVKKSMIL